MTCGFVVGHRWQWLAAYGSSADSLRTDCGPLGSIASRTAGSGRSPTLALSMPSPARRPGPWRARRRELVPPASGDEDTRGVSGSLRASSCAWPTQSLAAIESRPQSRRWGRVGGDVGVVSAAQKSIVVPEAEGLGTYAHPTGATDAALRHCDTHPVLGQVDADSKIWAPSHCVPGVVVPEHAAGFDATAFVIDRQRPLPLPVRNRNCSVSTFRLRCERRQPRPPCRHRGAP